jgi:hypothetical protein
MDIMMEIDTESYKIHVLLLVCGGYDGDLHGGGYKGGATGKALSPMCI